MPVKLIDIPIIEDIYDFDSITLREVTDNVHEVIKRVEKEQEKDGNSIAWLKKARRFLDLAQQEVEERRGIENFGNFCVSNNDSVLMEGDLSKKQTPPPQNQFGNVDDWIKLHEQISMQQQQQNNLKQTGSKFGIFPDQIKEQDGESDEEDEGGENETHLQKNHQKHGEDDWEDLNEAAAMKARMKGKGSHTQTYSDMSIDTCNKSTVSGHSLVSSSGSSQAKYLSHQKRIKSKQKQDEMQEFIRKTLEKTRITSTTNSAGTSFQISSYNFHQGGSSSQSRQQCKNSEVEEQQERNQLLSIAEPKVIKKKKKQSSQVSSSREKFIRGSEMEESLGNEYSNVQSRIKQDLEQQRLKKQENQYFTTGKQSYPKYKPPLVEKIDPEEERKQKTKNFLKRSLPSVQLPPISVPKMNSKSSSMDGKSSNDKKSNSNLTSRSGSRATSVLTSASTENRSEKLEDDLIRKSLERKKLIKPLSGHTKLEGLKSQDNLIKEDKSKNQPVTELVKGLHADGKANINEKENQLREIDENQGERKRNETEHEVARKENSNETNEVIEVIQEEIISNSIVSIDEKSVPGQPRKLTKGEQFKIKTLTTNLPSVSSKHHIQTLLDSSAKGEDLSDHAQIQIDEDIQEEKSVVTNKLEGREREREGREKEGREGEGRERLEDKGKNIDTSVKEDIIGFRREVDENPSDDDDDDEEREIQNREVTCGRKINYSLGRPDMESEVLDKEKQREECLQLKKTNENSGMITDIYKRGEEIADVNNDDEFYGEEQLEDGDNEEKGYIQQIQGEEFKYVEENSVQDRKNIVNNAKKLQSQGINDQLRQRMDKIINTFKESSDEVCQIEETFKEAEADSEVHKNKIDVKKTKNQIFGQPSSFRKESTDAPFSVASVQDDKIKGRTNVKDDKNVKEAKNTKVVIDPKHPKDAKGLIDTKNALKEQKDAAKESVVKRKSTQLGVQLNVEVAADVNKRNEKEQSLSKKKVGIIAGTDKATPSSGNNAQKPPNPNPTSKLLTKMMKEIQDESLVDYTGTIPTFSHLFSGYFNSLWSQSNPMMGGHMGLMNGGGSGNFCLIDQMREIYSLFQQHVEKVDNGDKGLLRYKQVVTPLEVLPSEVYYVNDPQKVAVYSNRVDIDMKKFIERQIIFTQRMNGENFAGHLLPHEESYYRVVKSKSEVYDIISRSLMRKKEWFELPHGLSLRTSWNLLWTWSKPQIDFNKLLLFQKVNHFPFNKNLVRKDLLKKNFERITKLGAKAAQVFNILPLTFVLPKEYCNFSERFYEEMLREGEQNIWIMKPVGKSQGRGISLVNDIAQVVYAEPVVVQKYMKEPLLLDGYKFDMRIYALITHMKPLEAFVYREGFARLSTEKYALNPQNIRNNQIHLTNFSIQKHHYDASANNANFIGGTKISLRMLQDKLRVRGIDWKNIWVQVQEIIVKSMLACQADIPNNPNCFEIFGYDIIIDSSLKCILLEINSSPSLARDFIIDDLIKQNMIDDAIDLVAPVQFDRLRLLEVLDRRIREEQGNKSNINTTNNSKLQLNRDINYILRGQKLRQFGETPAFLGQWLKVAPTEMSDKYHKIIQSYKLPSVRQSNASAANNNNTID